MKRYAQNRRIIASEYTYGIPEYRTAIIDEIGHVMYWCDELQGWDQIESILIGHPEWGVIAIEQ